MAKTYEVSNQQAKAKKSGGRANLEALLIHTKHHPKGRVQIDPETGRVRNPKNNVISVKRVPVRVEGQVVREDEVNVNGGHARKDGSVWRVALAGPARYHLMVTSDDDRFAISGRSDRTAPHLVGDEMREYQYFRSYLHDNPTEMPATRDDLTVDGKLVVDEIDEAFYAWLAEQDQKKITIYPMSVPVNTAPGASSVR